MNDLPTRLAALHALSFEGTARWSVDAFVRAQTDPAMFLCPPDTADMGFALGRTVAGEAELRTIVVPPQLRHRGYGRRLLTLFEADAITRGATEAFLEVAEDNIAARTLYTASGWEEVGRRPAYYGPIAAVGMRKSL